jgi:hypothetical protein
MDLDVLVLGGRARDVLCADAPAAGGPTRHHLRCAHRLTQQVGK